MTDKEGCYQCGEQGHFSRECPKSNSYTMQIKDTIKTNASIAEVQDTQLASVQVVITINIQKEYKDKTEGKEEALTTIMQDVMSVVDLDTLQEIVLNREEDSNVIAAIKKVTQLKTAHKEIERTRWNVINVMKQVISLRNVKVNYRLKQVE